MIETQIVAQKMKEHLIQSFLNKKLAGAGQGGIEIKKTPMGEKIIIHTSRPGMVVGKKGANMAELTKILKEKFSLENPQLEVVEIENPNLNPHAVSEKIISTFDRFGPKRFKSAGYRALQDIMDAGAVGAEVVISGRGVPSTRAKSWRFKAGHLKKSGDISANHMARDISTAELNSGSVGIKVSILLPDVKLPDDIQFIKIETTEDPAVQKEQNLAKEKKPMPKMKRQDSRPRKRKNENYKEN
jgi:small subunit ribosomal protein S3